MKKYVLFINTKFLLNQFENRSDKLICEKCLFVEFTKGSIDLNIGLFLLPISIFYYKLYISLAIVYIYFCLYFIANLYAKALKNDITNEIIKDIAYDDKQSNNQLI